MLKCTSYRYSTGANIVQNPSFNHTFDPWKKYVSGNWGYIGTTFGPPGLRSFHARAIGSGTDIVILDQDNVLFPLGIAQLKCSIYVRASKQGQKCAEGSVGFQVVVGGVTCASLRITNEADYVEDATVDFTTTRQVLRITSDGQTEISVEQGNVSGDVKVIIDAKSGSETAPVDIWVDDVVVKPVYKKCVAWALAE